MQRGGEIVGRSTTLDITSTVVPPQPTQPAVAPRSPFVAAAAAVASAVDHRQHAVAAADAEQTEGQSAAGAGGGGGGPTAMDTHDCDGHAHLHHHTSNEDGHGAICTAATKGGILHQQLGRSSNRILTVLCGKRARPFDSSRSGQSNHGSCPRKGRHA